MLKYTGTEIKINDLGSNSGLVRYIHFRVNSLRSGMDMSLLPSTMA